MEQRKPQREPIPSCACGFRAPYGCDKTGAITRTGWQCPYVKFKHEEEDNT